MDIDVSPDMRFYNLLESYPYTPTSALCEFIDNALEAFTTASQKEKKHLSKKLKIQISFNSSNDSDEITSIIIEDNGVGISVENIQRAMKPAYTPGKQSLSEFGIGMKAAAIWFGNNWILKSNPVTESKSFHLNFDLATLLETNSDSIEAVFSEREGRKGVRLEISSLKHKITQSMVKSIWESLEEIYMLFSYRTGPVLDLHVELNGTSLSRNENLKHELPYLTFPQVRFYKNTVHVIGKDITWKKNISFKFNGLPVKGFIALRETSSQATNPGIRLFRYKRLIKGFEKRPYRPIDLLGSANKHAPSRFYGELHLDGQKISNSKGDFIFDEALFLETLENQDGVSQFIDQAEYYRINKIKAGEVKYYKDVNEFELKAYGKASSDDKGDSTPSPGASGRTKKKKTGKKPTPISILENVSISEDLLILDTFISETKSLYYSGRWWPFCLCYRVILEISIIEKLKRDHHEHYDKVKDKSIVALFNYLHSNSNIIPSEYRSLKRTLKENFLGTNPFIDILNLSSHGHYVASKLEADQLLQNTQQLIQWLFE